jgi:hypothetical protein
MSYNYSLNYRTFDELVADVSTDFRKYKLSDSIFPEDLIKIARKVNYDLGLRINQTREVVIEVEKGKAKLPNDFSILNFALSCGSYKAKQYLPQGTQVEEKIIGKVLPEYQVAPPETVDLCEVELEPEPCDPCDPCAQCGQETACEPCSTCCANPDSCTINCDGELVQLVQTLTSETRTFTHTHPIKILSNSRDIDCDCPNLYWDSPYTAYIKDGWLYMSYETGKVYLNYEGLLQNEEGDLLVPDHEFLNEYYEYALKDRILENLIMNDEEMNPNKIQLIKQGLRAARNNALNVVNTPNFAELRDLYQANRNAQHSKFYDMFKSHPRRRDIQRVNHNRKPWR